MPQECWEQWSRRDGHLPQVWEIKEDFQEEVAPGLCVLELDWKGCLWLGKNFESREPKRAKSVVQGKGSGDCLYAPGIKEGVGGLAFVCFAMTQTRSETRGTFGSPPAAFLVTYDGQGSDPAKILSPTKPKRTGWAPFQSLLTNTTANLGAEGGGLQERESGNSSCFARCVASVCHWATLDLTASFNLLDQ